MKRKYIIPVMASLLALGGCDYNEDNFAGLDEMTRPTDVRNDTLRLVDSDYAAIANNSTNKEIALSKDPEGNTYAAALAAVGANKYFTEDAPAAWYLPTFISGKFPYLDDNSKVTVYYNNFENLPEYLKDFNGITAYDLSSDDYKIAWGEGVNVSFLSPSTVSKIPSILKESISNPADGATRVVNYAYSETEPSFGGEGGVEETYNDIAEIIASGAGSYKAKGEILATYARGFLLGDKTGSILVYLNNPANYSIGDVVTVSGETSQYSGFAQFTQNAEIALVERNSEFKYPSATNMSGAEMDAWTSNAVVKYVSITGKLVISGSYYNLEVDGAEHQGSISYPAAGLVSEELNGKVVTVTGYLIGYSSKFVNMMATSVVESGTQSEYTPVGVISFSAAGNYKAKGTVAAIYGRGFLLNDGTGSILVYLNKAPENKIGDIVTVSGKTSSYAGFMQFGNNSVVEKVGETSFKYPAVRTLTGADMDAYLELPYIAYVAYEGTLEIDGFYYNVTVDGAETAVGSISYVPDGLVDPALNGKKVIVTGYSIGVSGSRYVNTMAVKVEEATATTRAALAMTRASVTPNTSAVYRYNASSQSWSKYSTDAADIAVLQPADYTQMGYSYVSKPAETLPVYLQHTYPYAKTDDVVAVVYKSNSDGAIAATEFTYDGATWTQTTVASSSIITFQKMGGEWVEARVYLESSLLNGESGGFTAQDIELSSLSYVWKLDNSYGWKGSGYASGNQEAESWLISPEIDLTKAVAPTMVFDIAINFLSGNDLKNHLNAKISTNFSGDATTATWETLEITGWPEGTSWDFSTIEPVSLSHFVGQKIRLAFHYKSTAAVAPTVEIKNISIKE